MLVFLEAESYIAICFFIAQLCVIIRASLFSMGSEFLVILGRILDLLLICFVGFGRKDCSLWFCSVSTVINVLMDWSFEVLRNHLSVKTVIMWQDSVPSILVVYRFEVFCGILPKLTPNKTGMFLYFEFWLLYFFFNFEIVLLQFFHICFSHHAFLFLSKRKTVGET